MQSGLTPLLKASFSGHREKVEVLLAHKADIHAKTKVSRGEGCEGAPSDGGMRGWRVRWGGLGIHAPGVGVWGSGVVMA